MKLVIFISALMLTTQAQGWQFPKVGAEGAIEEMHQHEWLEKHKLAAVSHETKFSTGTNYRAIDGQNDVIIVSDARTGLPDEFIEIPNKPKMREIYNGR